MTRLTPKDVGDLVSRLDTFELGLREITGLGLRGVAIRSVAHDPVCVPLIGARLAVVPITSGEGVISGFADCVATILGHLGCEAWVTAQPDVRGIQAAVAQGADALFMADDHRFIALDLRHGRCIDDDPATADRAEAEKQHVAAEKASRRRAPAGEPRGCRRGRGA